MTGVAVGKAVGVASLTRVLVGKGVSVGGGIDEGELVGVRAGVLVEMGANVGVDSDVVLITTSAGGPAQAESKIPIINPGMIKR
jgi:hypothetical protein